MWVIKGQSSVNERGTFPQYYVGMSKMGKGPCFDCQIDEAVLYKRKVLAECDLNSKKIDGSVVEVSLTEIGTE